MKKNMVKVYLQWFNYEGKDQEKELVATFRSIKWAERFVEASQDAIDDRFSRFIIEE